MKALAAVLGLVIGVALGLWGGWVLWPVEYANITPDLLGADHQVDYVLMIAATYEADGDLDAALSRLARLGDDANVALLNTFLVAEDNPPAMAGLQKLAAELGVHASFPDTPE